LTAIERYITLLQKQICDQGTALQAISSVVTFWKFAPQRIIISMSKLITYRIIPPSAVVEWVFSEEILSLHRKHWVWELLVMTCDQTVTTIDLLQKKLNDLEDPTLSAQPDPRLKKEEIDLYKRAEDNLAAALQEQREFFLRLFQRFETHLKHLIDVITQKKRSKSKDGGNTEKNGKDNINSGNGNQSTTSNAEGQAPESVDSDEYNYKINLGMFNAIGRKYYKELKPLRETLDILLANTEPAIVVVYEQFSSIIKNY